MLLDLLAPSARLMGEMWTADQVSFVDVTLGLSRIQQLLRQLRNMTDGSAVSAVNKGRALLVPAPGEQHTFGLRVVEEFLLRDGWEVRSNLRATEHDILHLVAEDATTSSACRSAPNACFLSFSRLSQNFGSVRETGQSGSWLAVSCSRDSRSIQDWLTQMPP